MPLASFLYPIFKGMIKHKHFVGRMFLKILNVSVRNMEMQVIILLGKKNVFAPNFYVNIYQH